MRASPKHGTYNAASVRGATSGPGDTGFLAPERPTRMIPWLHSDSPFPPVDRALRRPNGLLAAGADLSPARLLDGYRHGIFPWFSQGEPILWWSPDPRMLLFPAEFKISRSLAKRLRRREFTVQADTVFDEVVRCCAEPRLGQDGTWITAEMRQAYQRLHELGYAHSVESWQEGELAGGLYGVAIGRVFYGESMFSRRTDASKVALAHLVRYLESHRFRVIDCQMNTAHLASLGAREISRKEFVTGLKLWTYQGEAPARWPAEALSREFAFAP
jgi:leucyl/phenylalanyl-tRNA---protein transferase